MPLNSHRKLPTLIALPIEQFCFPTKTKRKVGIELGEDKKLGVRQVAMIEAMDSLRALIELTQNFLLEAPDYTRNIDEWLDELKGTLNCVEVCVRQGYLDIDVTIESEGVSELDELLCRIPELEEEFGIELELLVHALVNFWVREIKRRARELFYLSLSAVDTLQAKHAFIAMKELRYPLVQAEN